MNIIFGRENVVALEEKYTVLELDTFRIGVDGPVVTAFCAVDSIPIIDMPKVASMQALHENLLENYRKKDWNYCTQALEHLTGFWGKELDTFYNNLATRIAGFTEQDPGESWDGIIEKVIS